MMSSSSRKFSSGFVFLLLVCLLASGSGGHICQVQESYTVMRTESYTKTITVETQYFCLSHFICSKYRLHSFTAYRQVPEVRYMNVDICCPGWIGEDCDIACAVGFHGTNCVNECRCENDAVCQPTDGACLCQPGYKGRTCSEKCEAGSFGHYCLKQCSSCPVEQCDHRIGCVTTTTSTTTMQPTTTSTTTTTVESTTKASTKSAETTLKEASTKSFVPSQLSANVFAPPAEESNRQSAEGSKIASVKANPAKSGGQGSSSISTKIAVPVCLLILVVALVFVVIFTKRRLRKVPASENYAVQCTTPTYQSCAADCDNARNHMCEVSHAGPQAEAATAAGVSHELIHKQMEHSGEGNLPCVSYRSRMNNLNTSLTTDCSDEDEDQVNIIKPSTPKVHNKVNTSLHVDQSAEYVSDEENN